jgi:hypothetical protein
MAPLLCGVVAVFQDELRIESGGSGILISPRQFLTATHVMNYLTKTWTMRGSDRHALFQFVEPPGRMLIWDVRAIGIPEPDTLDLCLLDAEVNTEESSAPASAQATKFLEWALEPPSVGAEVVMLGYPRTDTSGRGVHKTLHAKPVVTIGRVVEVFSPRHDRGQYSFPCFSIDQPIDHGASGGPVLWNGRLCGLVWGGNYVGGTMASALWPLCLCDPIVAKLESGTIRATDWPTLRGRASWRNDSSGEPELYIKD